MDNWSCKCFPARYLIVFLSVIHFKQSRQGALFSSNFFLVKLVKLERELLPQFKSLSLRFPSHSALNDFVQEVNSSRRLTPDNYVSHPLNSLKLIKRWTAFQSFARNASATTNDGELERFLIRMGRQLKKSKIPFPTDDDVREAYKSIIRLQTVYNLNLTTLRKGLFAGVKPTHNLVTDDYFRIAQEAQGDVRVIRVWYQLAFESTQDKETKLRAARSLVAMCLEMLDKSCVEFYATEAHRLDPVQIPLTAVEQVVNSMSGASTEEKPTLASADAGSPGMDLCRESIKPSKVRTVSSRNLICVYKPSSSPFHFYQQEILSWDPPVSVFKNFLADRDIAAIRRAASQTLEPSETKVGASSSRISAGTWVSERDLPILRKLSKRISEMTGLNTFYDAKPDDPEQSENFQVVNYGLGGHYVPHSDYYVKSPLDTEYNPVMKKVGNRVATFLIYLTDVKAGGATVFPRLNLFIKPRKGTAAFWFNAKASGEEESRTYHGSCPILYGNKWIANKWIGGVGQEFKRPCALNPEL